MIGIVIVSHEKISKELFVALEHIVGKQEKIEAISIFLDALSDCFAEAASFGLFLRLLSSVQISWASWNCLSFERARAFLNWI